MAAAVDGAFVVTDGPSLDDRIQVATVTHRTRVALAFGAIAAALLWLAFWVTQTPRRWIALLVGAVCAGVLLAVLR